MYYDENLAVGDKVIDKWEPYNWGESMYKHVSVGIVLDISKRKYARHNYSWNRVFYRIHWTFGPKNGKITTMRYVSGFDICMEKRKTIMQDRTHAFDQFLSNDFSKEQ